MLDESYDRNIYNRNNRSRNEAYRRRTEELRSSQHFWSGDRIIHPSLSRILFIMIGTLIISLSIWVICTSFIQDMIVSALIAIVVFSGLSILLQPQISYRIRGAFSSLSKAAIETVDFMNDIQCFFYRDKDTGELHKDVLFFESRGRIAAFGLFKIDTIPISISGKFNDFIRSIYGQKIPIFWNYVQAPINEKEVKRLKNVTLDMRKFMDSLGGDGLNSFLLNREGVWEARIVFGTSDNRKIGTNVAETIQEVYENVKLNLQKLESSFLVNFPHSKLVLLEDKDLLAAKRVQITDGGKFRFF